MITDVADLGTILGIWAHPDDEAYLMGGLMAAATSAGQRVVCVTATLGDAGETADPSRWPRHELSTIRPAELQRSMEILGVQEHEHLGLPDGDLASLDPTEPIERLTDILHAVKPQTVITFGPDGMTGHPDHTAVSVWVARTLARTPRPPRLLHATKSSTWVARFPDLNSQVFPDLPPPEIPDELAIWFPFDDEVVDRKVRALEAHASQTTGLIAAVGRERYAEWVRDEYFAPVPRPTSS